MSSETQQLLQAKQVADLFNNVDLPASPKELEGELTEYQDYLVQQYNSLVLSQTINNFKKAIIHNTLHHSQDNDLNAAKQERIRQLNVLKKYQQDLQQYQHNINASVALLEADTNTIHSSQQEAEELEKDIMRMEAKIKQVNEACSYTLEYTANEAKQEIKQATEAFASLASLHDQVSDACDNKGIKEKALRIEVVKLDAKRDAYSQDAQLVSNSYQVADKSIEEKCQGYKKYIEILSRIAGVEEMMEANGELKVSYALPYDTQLTISYDDAPRIIDAKTTGHINIKDLVEIANNMNYMDGVKMMIVETLFRLNNKTKILKS